MSKKRIFKKSLAIKLIHEGCELVDIQKNRKYPTYDIYVFKNNDNFQKVLAQLS
ncbi:hypothetical protein KGR20_21100 [Cytobacillus oceanisediminis]|uniref:DUF5659 domain-containing protein n=1 Tax=Cytobacillus oceanisediminis TaxID=665099 RepID=UPI001CCB4677|nr:DUF5659 domain-containing protein [Cytobacillus oceanisediminis]MBZ9536664.1 hypothetical protein [Cytobacillus oceanisediminis]